MASSSFAHVSLVRILGASSSLSSSLVKPSYFGVLLNHGYYFDWRLVDDDDDDDDDDDTGQKAQLI